MGKIRDLLGGSALGGVFNFRGGRKASEDNTPDYPQADRLFARLDEKLDQSGGGMTVGDLARLGKNFDVHAPTTLSRRIDKDIAEQPFRDDLDDILRDQEGPDTLEGDF